MGRIWYLLCNLDINLFVFVLVIFTSAIRLLLVPVITNGLVPLTSICSKAVCIAQIKPWIVFLNNLTDSCIGYHVKVFFFYVALNKQTGSMLCLHCIQCLIWKLVKIWIRPDLKILCFWSVSDLIVWHQTRSF